MHRRTVVEEFGIRLLHSLNFVFWRNNDPTDGAADTPRHPINKGQRLAIWLLAIAFGFAGYKHLTAPAGFVAITPNWVPKAELLIWITGWCEIAGAIGLLISPSLIRWARPAAGVALALYSLCVWPANFNHAVHDIPVNGVQLGWWYHGPRLALQPVIIWAALYAGGVIRWPFGHRRRKSH